MPEPPARPPSPHVTDADVDSPARRGRTVRRFVVDDVNPSKTLPRVRGDALSD